MSAVIIIHPAYVQRMPLSDLSTEIWSNYERIIWFRTLANGTLQATMEEVGQYQPAGPPDLRAAVVVAKNPEADKPPLVHGTGA